MKSSKITFQNERGMDLAGRVVEMAHKCPVHRTLIGPIRIRVNED